MSTTSFVDLSASFLRGHREGERSVDVARAIGQNPINVSATLRHARRRCLVERRGKLWFPVSAELAPVVHVVDRLVEEGIIDERHRNSAYVLLVGTTDAEKIAEITGLPAQEVRSRVERLCTSRVWVGEDDVYPHGIPADVDPNGYAEFLIHCLCAEGEILARFDDGPRWFATEPEPAEMPDLRSEGPKIGRNAPCPCGSGKKYKKCCINRGAAP